MEFNVPFQHKYGYIRDEKLAEEGDGNARAESGEHRDSEVLQNMMICQYESLSQRTSK